MISAPIYNNKGDAGEKKTLSSALFEVKVSERLLAQAVRVYLSNQRKAKAKTKTRGEVSKTTAKMYKQKGTGRARHGAYSAPIFVGGGIAHGPRGVQNYHMNLPAKMIKKALVGALSEKAKAKEIVVISGKVSSNKTKEAAGIIKTAKLENKSVLAVFAKTETQLGQGWRNLAGVTVVTPNLLSAYTILNHRWLVISEKALEEAEKIYAN